MTDHDLKITTDDGRVVVSVTALSDDASTTADDVAATLKDAHGAVEQ